MFHGKYNEAANISNIWRTEEIRRSHVARRRRSACRYSIITRGLKIFATLPSIEKYSKNTRGEKFSNKLADKSRGRNESGVMGGVSFFGGFFFVLPTSVSETKRIRGEKGPRVSKTQYFFDSLSGITNRLIPCQGIPPKKKKKTNVGSLGSIVAQLAEKNLERKGFETGEKRSPNVIGSPRPDFLSLLYLLSADYSFNRRLSCFRWACTGVKTGSRFFRFLPTEMRHNPPRSEFSAARTLQEEERGEGERGEERKRNNNKEEAKQRERRGKRTFW